MRCPKCNRKMRVIDSRDYSDAEMGDKHVWRRHVCDKDEQSYISEERIVAIGGPYNKRTKDEANDTASISL